MSQSHPDPAVTDRTDDDEVDDVVDDPYLWLEDVTGDRPLDWVRARNDEAVAELAGGPRHAALKAELLEALDADDRIPYIRRRGAHLYNFWQDAAHPRGLWRRTTLESYRTAAPDWEVLIDVDALAEGEDQNWVWKGATVLRPDHRLALVELSRGGADASVVREFDLVDRRFVPDGFSLPEAKTSVSWIDADHIFVGTDFGPGSLTRSGYPRVVKRWSRGSLLADAEQVFEGEVDDVAVAAWHDPTEGFERDVVGRYPDFFTSEEYLLGPDGDVVHIDVPEDADASLHRAWLLVRLRSPWTTGGAEHRAGSLLAADVDAFLAGDRALTTLFEPDEHRSLTGYVGTRHHLILTTLVDVRTELEVLTPDDGWARAPLPGVPEMGDATVVDTDPDHIDEYFLDTQAFLEPATLRRGVIGRDARGHAGDDAGDPGGDAGDGAGGPGGHAGTEVLRQAPSRFDATGLRVRQQFAPSDDGTRVPYFVIGPEDASPRTGPTLLTGYGGFEVSRTPSYSAIVGRGWLARGGTYVVANIRGGGEYGPAWHKAAMRERRPRAYEDFAAVARDLVDRGITTPERLGIHGGSNGGLLMGVMLTTHPELFGAIVCQVPLLDMRRYHRLLAGASWMAEYGDPDDPDDWAFLRTFSPYHLVEKGRDYPPVLFTTSTRDDRVHPGHARKTMARMADLGYDVRYYENIEGGHGGAANNEQTATMWALALEFCWQQLDDRR
jgi:prolyl oligopeptidase